VKSIRLLPIVVFAAFALLVLKTVGLVTEGGFVLVGTPVARAEQLEISKKDEQAAGRASETLFSRADQAPVSSTQLDAVPVTENNNGDKIAIGSTDGLDQTERAVLERLSERRGELDVIAKNLETRSALVEAAEKRLAERIASLEAIEGRINALVDEKKAMNDSQFAGVVSMYETMKPGDAAAIFDSLDMEVLLRVARNMNPRKLAPVLAKMSTERAQDLTLGLAAVQPEPALDGDIEDITNLPQIVGK